MGSYANFTVSDYTLFSFKSTVPNEFLTIFRESDRQASPSVLQDDEVVEGTFVYAAQAQVVRERLDVMGFSFERAQIDFRASISEIIQEYEEDAESNHTNERVQFLNAWSFEKWATIVQDILRQGVAGWDRREILESLTEEAQYVLDWDNWEMGEPFGFPCSDVRFMLRAFLQLFPADSIVELDYTELVAGGYCPADAALTGDALENLAKPYLRSERIIIMTEGTSDTRILQASLGILYPHLTEFYTFLDFELASFPGGTGSLVNALKALVSAGIRNRIVAVFDNDTAASEALRGLSALSIPENIVIVRLPFLPLATQYPTLGPQGAIAVDINGKACSLELYLGEDVLRDGEGALTPVQWTSFNPALGQYHGEIMQKAILHSRFFTVLSALEKGSKVNHDWEPIHLILQAIFQAFR